MRNEYGVKLDSNGYAPSIIDLNGDCCYRCKKSGDLARHEVFHGSDRNKSKALGCWINLCPTCHTELHAKDAEIDWAYKRVGQKIAMRYYDWTTEEFIKRFGRNYL